MPLSKLRSRCRGHRETANAFDDNQLTLWSARQGRRADARRLCRERAHDAASTDTPSSGSTTDANDKTSSKATVAATRETTNATRESVGATPESYVATPSCLAGFDLVEESGGPTPVPTRCEKRESVDAGTDCSAHGTPTMVSASGRRCVTNAEHKTHPTVSCPWDGDWSLRAGQCETTTKVEEIRTTVDEVQYKVEFTVRVAPFTAQVRVAPYTKTVRVAPFTETVTQSYTRRQRYCAQYDTEFGTGCIQWAYRNKTVTVTETVDAYNYEPRDVYHYQPVDAYNYETRTRWECCKSVIREVTVMVDQVTKRDPRRTCPTMYALNTNTNHCERPAGTDLGSGTAVCDGITWTLNSGDNTCSRILPGTIHYGCGAGDTKITPATTPPTCRTYVCPADYQLASSNASRTCVRYACQSNFLVDASTTPPECVRYVCEEGYQLDTATADSAVQTRTCARISDESEPKVATSFTHTIGGRWDGDVECDRSGLLHGVHAMVLPDSALMPTSGSPFMIMPGTAGRLCIDATLNKTLTAVIIGATTDLGCTAITIGAAALATKRSGGTLGAYIAAHPGTLIVAQSTCTAIVGGLVDHLLPESMGGRPDVVIALPGSALEIEKPPVRYDGDVECDRSGLLHGVHAMVLPDGLLLPTSGSPYTIMPGTAGNQVGSLCLRGIQTNPVIVFVEKMFGNTVCSAIELGSAAPIQKFSKGTLKSFVNDNRGSMVALSAGCAGFVSGTGDSVLPIPFNRRADAVITLPSAIVADQSDDTSADRTQSVPQVSISGGNDVTEGGNVTITVSALPKPTASITVNVTVSAVGSYGVSSGNEQVTIGSSGTGTLTVATSDDSVDEADGSVTAAIASGRGYTGTGSATVTVSDDDDPMPSVPAASISGPSSVIEGAKARFVISVSPNPKSDVLVKVKVTSTGDYGVADRTAGSIGGCERVGCIA